MQDPFVIRKHAQMLMDAGIDMLPFDTSNGYNYENTVAALLNVYRQMRAEGLQTSPPAQAQGRNSTCADGDLNVTRLTG